MGFTYGDSVYDRIQCSTRPFLEKCGLEYNSGYTFVRNGSYRHDPDALVFKIYYFGHAQTKTPEGEPDHACTVFSVNIGHHTIKSTRVPHTAFQDENGKYSEELFFKEMFKALECGKEFEEFMRKRLAYQMASTRRQMQAQNTTACQNEADEILRELG